MNTFIVIMLICALLLGSPGWALFWVFAGLFTCL